MRTAFDDAIEQAAGPEQPAVPAARKPNVAAKLLRNPSVVVGGGVLILTVAIGVLSPWLGTVDPIELNPIARNRPPGAEHWFGTDHLGRDLYSRMTYGIRVSLFIGVVVAAFSIAIGVTVGLLSGYIRWLDPFVMRIMDGIMAIPNILLAITLVAVSGASVRTVILAITIPEIPRVVRLVRGVVLSVREEPYVEAAISLGTRTSLLMVRHILPNTVAPMLVLGTYICASAMIVEALLSFLGAGIPPEVPSWGNTMAEGRTFFRIAPWVIFFPGILLTVTVLAVNILGDGLRDTLDPKMGKAG